MELSFSSVITSSHLYLNTAVPTKFNVPCSGWTEFSWQTDYFYANIFKISKIKRVETLAHKNEIGIS